MVPIEQLSDSNFLNVYYIASEIKRELEVTPDSKKHIDIKKSYVYSATNPSYPCFYDTRIQTVKYIQGIGQIANYYDLDRKISIEVIPQDDFFSFCNNLVKISNERFAKTNGNEEKVNALTNEQIKKIKQIMDAIFIKFESERKPNSMIFTSNLVIPYNHFPLNIEPFDVNGIIYKLVNDFKVIVINKKPSWFAENSNKQDAIDIKFKSGYGGYFKDLKDVIDDKYKTIATNEDENNKINNSEIKTNEVKSILLITPQYSNFDFYWVVLNHDYEKKHKLSIINKQTKRHDGIGYNLWTLCEEKKVDFDASFLNYMNDKIFKVKVFKDFKKTKLVQIKNQKILINNGIVLEKKSKELLDKDILKYFS